MPSRSEIPEGAKDAFRVKQRFCREPRLRRELGISAEVVPSLPRSSILAFPKRCALSARLDLQLALLQRYPEVGACHPVVWCVFHWTGKRVGRLSDDVAFQPSRLLQELSHLLQKSQRENTREDLDGLIASK